MVQRISIMALMLFVTASDLRAQAVDVPLDVVIPIEFDATKSVKGPNTVSLPNDYSHESILNRARGLLDVGDDLSLTRQLGPLLRLPLEDDTVIQIGRDNVGLREQVARFVLRLPPSAREAYVAQFEPDAAIALASVRADSAVSFADVASEFPGTPSAESALLSQAFLEYDRGRPAIAVEFLRRLQQYSANGVLPAKARRLAEACLADQSNTDVATEPVCRPWSTQTDDIDRNEEQLERVNAHMLAIPSVRAIVKPGSVVTTDLHSVSVFDQATGEVRFRVKLNHPQSESRFAGEGATPWFNADQQRLVVVQRYESDRESPPNRYTKQIRQIEPRVFPVWPPDDYMNTPMAVISSKIVAYDLNTGTRLWSAGGMDFADPALRDATICGRPVVNQGEVFLLAEADSTLRLVVLEAIDGQTLWKQQVGWADRSINEDLDRAETDCSPIVYSDIVICPTAAGKLIAVDRVTRCLKWAYEYSTSSVVQFEHHQVFADSETPTGSWLGDALHRNNDFLVVAAPDSAELICIDASTGRRRWHQPQGDNRYVVHIDDEHVWTLAPDNITKWQLTDGSIVQSEALPSVVTGIGTVHRGQIVVSTSGGMISIDPATCVATNHRAEPTTSVKKSPFKTLGGNLTSSGNALIENSASGIRLFNLAAKHAAQIAH